MPAEFPEPTTPNKSPAPPCIVAVLVFFVVAVVIGVQVFRVLYAVIFHADAPLPAGSSITAHEQIAFGVDQWTYTSAQNPCEIMQFYGSQAGLCQVAAGVCEGAVYTGPDYALENIATCYGSDEYSIFGVRWEVVIYTQRQRGEVITAFDLKREMLWSGPAPAATSTAAP